MKNSKSAASHRAGRPARTGAGAEIVAAGLS